MLQRCVELPAGVDGDKMTARFDKGVLKILAENKPEAVTAPKKIEVNRF